MALLTRTYIYLPTSRERKGLPPRLGESSWSLAPGADPGNQDGAMPWCSTKQMSYRHWQDSSSTVTFITVVFQLAGCLSQVRLTMWQLQ